MHLQVSISAHNSILDGIDQFCTRDEFQYLSRGQTHKIKLGKDFTLLFHSLILKEHTPSERVLTTKDNILHSLIVFVICNFDYLTNSRTL